MHYKQLLDPAKYLGPVDFLKEREVTINRLVSEVLPAREGEERQKAPMMYLRNKDGTEYPRPMKVPKSVLHGLSLLLGTETDAWVGKKVVIFPAICMAFGEREECLRVRFPPAIDGQVRKWLKKRKASPSAYIIEEMKQQADKAPAPAASQTPAPAATTTPATSSEEMTREESLKAAIERGEA